MSANIILHDLDSLFYSLFKCAKNILRYPLEAYIDLLPRDIFEILLVDMAGINWNTAPLNAPAWYISILLLTEFSFYCLYYSFGDKFIHGLLPVSIILASGYVMSFQGQFSVKTFTGLTTLSALRGWFEIGLGYYCSLIAKRLSILPLSCNGKKVLTGVELLCHFCAIIILMTKSGRYWLYLLLILFIPAISIGVSGQSVCPLFFERMRLKHWFAKFSLSLFLIQQTVLSLYTYFFPNYEEKCSHFSSFVLVLLTMGIIYMLAEVLLLKRISRIKWQIRKYFLMEQERI